ncbi:MAG: TonB-dependent receptor [[Actinobacillus] rossii]|nr:TonB-dependent receptor [[Actinobacillus] rossii]
MNLIDRKMTSKTSLCALAIVVAGTIANPSLSKEPANLANHSAKNNVSDDYQVLDEINVSTSVDDVKTQEVFTKASAVSTRENISTSTQALDDIIRTVPGAFTNLDKSSGTVSINIRGLSGMGRVNTMVDGVSQTFYATAGDNSGKAGGTSQFGTLIDPSFIAGVDIVRGQTGGIGSGNALMGSANIRTIGVRDVITEGNHVGVMLNSEFGTNAIGPNYMGAVAAQTDIGDGYKLGLMYAYSQRKYSQDFKVGGGKNIKDVDNEDILALAYSGCAAAFNRDECVAESIDKLKRVPYDPSKLENHPKSHLAKIEFSSDKSDLTLQYREQKTALSGREITNKNHQLNYQYRFNDKWTLDFLLADTSTTQDYDKGTFFNAKALNARLKAKNRAKTADIRLTFSTPIGEDWRYTASLGANFLNNKYTKNRHPRELAYNFAYGEPADYEHCPTRPTSWVSGPENEGWSICNYHSTKSNTFQPDGSQRFKTFSFDQELTYDIYTLSFNYNRQIYDFSGTTYKRNKYIKGSDMKSGIKTANGYDVWINSSSEYYFNKYGYEKMLTLDECYQTTNRAGKYHDVYCDWNSAKDEPNVIDYKQVSRGKRAVNNYSFGFSADINPLFAPFITYSHTHRQPTIKEMFFSEIGDLGVNTDLRPEKAKTLQTGINGFKEGIFTDNDYLGFKVVAYRTRIRDYILNGKRDCSGQKNYDCYPHITHFNYAGGNEHYYVDQVVDAPNVPGGKLPLRVRKERPFGGEIVTIKGFEIELNYDTGRFFTNLSYSRQSTNQPASFADSSARANAIDSDSKYLQGFGLSKVSVLPKDYASFELGARFWDGRLVVGGKAKYYGKSKRARIDKEEGDKFVQDTTGPAGMKTNGTMRISGMETIRAQPMIFDFYVIAEPVRNLVLKAEVQNVFDRKYINPLDSNNDSASQTSFIMGDDLGQMNALNNYSRGRTWVFNMSYKF